MQKKIQLEMNTLPVAEKNTPDVPYSYEFACKNCGWLFWNLEAVNNAQWHFDKCEGIGFECQLDAFKGGVLTGQCADINFPHIHHFNILYHQWICTSCQRQFFTYDSALHHVKCHDIGSSTDV